MYKGDEIHPFLFPFGMQKTAKGGDDMADQEKWGSERK